MPLLRHHRYHGTMRRTVWILLLAWLFQGLSGSAWALGRSMHEAHGHSAPVPWPTEPDLSKARHAEASRIHTHHAQHQADAPDPHCAGQVSHAAGKVHGDHHCCAVGVGLLVPTLWPELPQATPRSPMGHWVSQSLRPDLRPPILQA